MKRKFYSCFKKKNGQSAEPTEECPHPSYNVKFNSQAGLMPGNLIPFLLL